MQAGGSEPAAGNTVRVASASGKPVVTGAVTVHMPPDMPPDAVGDGASVASATSQLSRSTIADVARRVSGASVVKVAQLHRELQDSVCARRLVVCMLLLALGISIAVAVVTSQYRDTATNETTSLLVKSTVATAIAGVRSFFEAKYGVQTVLSYAIDSGWFREPMDADRYDQIIAPFFVRQEELLALYNAHSSTKNTLKFSAEVDDEFFTESRWYRSDDHQERQRRVRASTADITTYELQPMVTKSYDPTLRSWYVLGDTLAAGERGWQGPDVQTSNAAGDLSVPVFSMVFKHYWPPAVGGYSVFRLKFSVEALTGVLTGLDIGPRGNAYVVNEIGEVVGARDPSVIVPVESNDSDGKFTKIWEIEAEPVLKLLNLDVLASNGDVGDHDAMMAHVRKLDIAGFSLVVTLHADDFLVKSRDINSLAALLSLVSIVVLVGNLVKMLSGFVMLAAHRYQERRQAAAAAREQATRKEELRVGMEASTMDLHAAAAHHTSAGGDDSHHLSQVEGTLSALEARQLSQFAASLSPQSAPRTAQKQAAAAAPGEQAAQQERGVVAQNAWGSVHQLPTPNSGANCAEPPRSGSAASGGVRMPPVSQDVDEEMEDRGTTPTA